jgi:hypothetical protein
LNGLAIVLLKYSMNKRIRWCNSSTEAKLPRFSSRRTRMENHYSTWLSQEVCFGV